MDPFPGCTRKVTESDNMMSSSNPPSSAVTRIDNWIPLWVSVQITANVTNAIGHHGMCTPNEVRTMSAIR